MSACLLSLSVMSLLLPVGVVGRRGRQVLIPSDRLPCFVQQRPGEESYKFRTESQPGNQRGMS
jgi:hypothetical protein